MATFPHGDGQHAAMHTHPMEPLKLPPWWFYNACRLGVGSGRRDVGQHEATAAVASGRFRVLEQALLQQRRPLQLTVRPQQRMH